MLLYVTLGTNDLARAGAFYDAVLPLLGYRQQKVADGEIGYAADDDIRCRFWIVTPFDGKTATHGNGTTIAFDAPTRRAVEDFHKAALALGGSDEGAPGLRSFHPDFYAAFVRDPDGNKLSAVCERPEPDGR